MSTQAHPDTKANIRKLQDGYMLQRSDGSIRFLEWYESLLYMVFGKKPKDFK